MECVGYLYTYTQYDRRYVCTLYAVPVRSSSTRKNETKSNKTITRVNILPKLRFANSNVMLPPVHGTPCSFTSLCERFYHSKSTWTHTERVHVLYTYCKAHDRCVTAHVHVVVVARSVARKSDNIFYHYNNNTTAAVKYSNTHNDIGRVVTFVKLSFVSYFIR